jgi:LuxR family transcriptional regulator, maltose regulon positive regulatory protein
LLVLQSLVTDAAGNTRRALATIRRALTLGVTERPIRVFVDAGPSLVPLLLKLRTIQRRGAHRDPAVLEYLDLLLAAFQPQPVPAAPHAPAAPPGVLIEPLSAREQDVLRLLVDGLGNRAIADKLVIAPSTVKRHLLNIYRKLDVQSRVAAVTRARALELI